MKTLAGAASLIIAALSVAAQPAVAQQPGAAQLDHHVLPVAAGALVGAIGSFSLLPLVIPALAATSTGVTVTSSPMIALIGAGVGGYVGYEFTHDH